MCSKIGRYLLTKHKGEKDVVLAMKHEKRSVERNKLLSNLRLRGDYHHNMDSLQTGSKGELIVVRRPGEGKECEIKDFLPCEFCFGFFRDLWKHQSSCMHKPASISNQQRAQTQRNARSGLNKILSALKCDDISCIVREDQLIKQFGAMQLEKDGEKNAQFISQKMRELGRLLKGLMEIDNIQAAQFLRSR